MGKVLKANTEKVLNERYYLRDPQGKQVETEWEQSCSRVAKDIASAYKPLRVTREKLENKYFGMMYDQVFSPNSPTWFNAGNPFVSKKSLSACYILHVPDDIKGIFKAIQDGAVIGKTGGGIGMDGSQIRPYGALTNSGGIASGVISFMSPFQAMSEAIVQGGRRRIAMMWMLAIWHPEILTFIDCKVKTGPWLLNTLQDQYGLGLTEARQISQDISWLEVIDRGNGVQQDAWHTPFSGFNISVKVTNEFMEAMKNDGLFMLRRAVVDDEENGPRAKKVHYEPWRGPVLDPRNDPDMVVEKDGIKYIRARRLWQRIIDSAWASAEPGIMFDDIVNDDNPVKSLGPIHNSNPCGEYYQVDNNSCNLGSINLSKFFIGDGKEGDWADHVNWEGLAETARLATRFLDGVIEKNEYPIPEITETTKASRPIGLGEMGVADLLIDLNIPYGSDLAIEVCTRLQQWIQYWAWVESTKLAEEYGPFPELKNNKDFFDKKMSDLTTDIIGHPAYKGKGINLNTGLFNLYKKHGVRNCHVTVIAPTGTISLIDECSSGIEPIFAFKYTRQDTVGVRTYYDPRAEAWLAKNPGKELPNFFVDANQVTPEQHVRMQAAFQKYCDNAISKTCNMPNDATKEDIDKIYKLAFELKLKGITVYRDGCREGVLVRDKKEESKPLTPEPEAPVVQQIATVEKQVIERPEFLDGGTYVIPDGRDGKMYLTANHQEDGRVIEVFLRENAGNEWIELTGRLISLLLRSNVPAKEIRQQLRRVGGQSSLWYNGKCFSSAVQLVDEVIFEKAVPYFKSKVRPIPAVVEVVLPSKPKQESKIEPQLNSLKCPECGAALRAASGCMECSDKCGYSKCK